MDNKDTPPPPEHFQKALTMAQKILKIPVGKINNRRDRRVEPLQNNVPNQRPEPMMGTRRKQPIGNKNPVPSEVKEGSPREEKPQVVPKTLKERVIRSKQRMDPKELKRKIEERGQKGKEAVEKLNSLGEVAIKDLKNTKGYLTSGGLKKLVGLVEEIEKERQELIKSREQQAKEKTPPMDFDTAFKPLLTKLQGTMKECETYMKEHLQKEGGTDMAYLAAQELRDQLKSINEGLNEPLNCMVEVGRALKSPEGVPTLDDLEQLASLAKDKNLPPEITNQAMELLIDKPEKVLNRLVDTGDSELLSTYYRLVGQDKVFDGIMERLKDQPKKLANLTKQAMQKDVGEWGIKIDGDQPLRNTTLATKLLTELGRRGGGKGLKEFSDNSFDLIQKSLPKRSPPTTLDQAKQGFNLHVKEKDMEEVVKKWKQETNNKTTDNLSAEELTDRLYLANKITDEQRDSILSNRQLSNDELKAVGEMTQNLLDTVTGDQFLEGLGPTVQTICSDIHQAIAEFKPLKTGNEQTDQTNKQYCDAIVGGYVMLRLVCGTLTEDAGRQLKEATEKKAKAKERLQKAQQLTKGNDREIQLKQAEEEFEKARKERETAALKQRYAVAVQMMLVAISNGTKPSGNVKGLIHMTTKEKTANLHQALSKLVEKGKNLREQDNESSNSKDQVINERPPSKEPQIEEDFSEPSNEEKILKWLEKEEAELTIGHLRVEHWKKLLTGTDYATMLQELQTAGVPSYNATGYIKFFMNLAIGKDPKEWLPQCLQELEVIGNFDRRLANLLKELQLKPYLGSSKEGQTEVGQTDVKQTGPKENLNESTKGNENLDESEDDNSVQIDESGPKTKTGKSQEEWEELLEKADDMVLLQAMATAKVPTGILKSYFTNLRILRKTEHREGLGAFREALEVCRMAANAMPVELKLAVKRVHLLALQRKMDRILEQSKN